MSKFTIRLKGGAGSGNHGHKGRPGHQGGSLPQGSSASAVSSSDKSPIKSKYGILDKRSLLKTVHTKDGDYEIHRRSGHTIIVSPTGAQRETYATTAEAEHFIDKFMSPKVEVNKPVNLPKKVVDTISIDADPDIEEINNILWDHRNLDNAVSAHADDDYDQMLDDLASKFSKMADKFKKSGQEVNFSKLLKTYSDKNNIKFKKDERDALAYILSYGYDIE